MNPEQHYVYIFFSVLVVFSARGSVIQWRVHAGDPTAQYRHKLKQDATV